MTACRICGQEKAARAIGVCASCLRITSYPGIIKQAHAGRVNYGLPASPPREKNGLRCDFCANECRILEGKTGFCGVRLNRQGRIQSVSPPDTILASIYYDPLPTNCCAAWFCRGSKESGVNLAVFLYGCNFDCLFCQNASHRSVSSAHFLPLERLVEAALAPEVRCVCFFGGSPEPQLSSVLRAGQEILRRSRGQIHICWEWNGAGNPSLIRQAAEISRQSRGTVKFDLKAWTPQLGEALCGVPLTRAYQNLALLGSISSEPDLLTATTLLVPYYVDEGEIENIARFLAEINPDFPYSLLIFHPDDRMEDLPVTPRTQVRSAYQAAKRHLKRVNIGNLHLLDLAP